MTLRRRLATLAALAALLFLVARASLLFAYAETSASPVWPPSGIALGALLLLGTRAWPRIFLGAFLANLAALSGRHAAPWPAMLFLSGAFSTANVAEAGLERWLLKRHRGGTCRHR